MQPRADVMFGPDPAGIDVDREVSQPRTDLEEISAGCAILCRLDVIDNGVELNDGRYRVRADYGSRSRVVVKATHMTDPVGAFHEAEVCVKGGLRSFRPSFRDSQERR